MNVGRVEVRWSAAAGALILALAVGVAAGRLLRTSESPEAEVARPVADRSAGMATTGRGAPTFPATDDESTIVVAADAASRAGIETAPAESAAGDSVLRLPATIEANANA